MKHNLKIEAWNATAKIEGDKLIEIREDRGFQKGDRVVYKPVDESGIWTPHDIEQREFEITFVTAYKQQPGWVAFCEKEVKDVN